MNNNQSISVIIPTLNRPKLIKRAISSVHNQTFKGLINCIVVDSSDNHETETVVEQFNITKENL